MPPIDLEHFRTRLLGLQQELREATAADDGAAPVELDQSRVGRLSRMDAMQGQAMSVEMRRRRKATLSEIACALERIDSGDFGDCQACGEPIAVARLELDPATRLCIGCASEAEKT